MHDEELRPLAWLNNKNLIQGIVLPSNASLNNHHNNKSNRNMASAYSNNSSNKSLKKYTPNPKHCQSDGVGSINVNNEKEQVANYEHISTPKKKMSSGNNIHGMDLGSEIQGTALKVGDLQQHVKGNIVSIGGTTTIHVGPSGTTTVVEYKSGELISHNQRKTVTNAIYTNANRGVQLTTKYTDIPIQELEDVNQNYHSTTSSTNFALGLTTPIKSTNITLPNKITLSPCIEGVHDNGTSSTVYRGQQEPYTVQQPEREPQNYGLYDSSNATPNGMKCGGNTVSATHHPHKKYLREKMLSLEPGCGSATDFSANMLSPSSQSISQSSGLGSIITVVSSPASSSNSMSSSTSASTTAVNGGNSPVPKPFYALGNATSIAVNYSHSSPAQISPPMSVSSIGSSAHAKREPVKYITLPSLELQSAKDNLDNLPRSSYQEMEPQEHQQSELMCSPTSYSSYDNDSLKDFEVSTTNSSTSGLKNIHSSNSLASNSPQKQKHPNNVPYDPHVHTNNKPPYSFSSLIFMAIEGSSEKALPVKEIYAWIVQHFPYFRTAPTGWKNSVRHNLSLNKSFVKVEKAPNMGKGSLWRVEQQQRPNLLQALTRSPFFPNSSMDKLSHKGFNESSRNVTYDSGDCRSGSPQEKNITHHNPRFDPKLFPKLSKAFEDMESCDFSCHVDIVGDENSADCCAMKIKENNLKYNDKNNNINNNNNDNNNNNNDNFNNNDNINNNNNRINDNNDNNSNNADNNNNSNSNNKNYKVANRKKIYNNYNNNSFNNNDNANSSNYNTNHSKTNNNNNNDIYIDIKNNNNNNNNAFNSNLKKNSNKTTITTDNIKTYIKNSKMSAANPNCKVFNKSLPMENKAMPITHTELALANLRHFENYTRNCSDENLDDVNAAAAMLALKHGPKVFSDSFQNCSPVITSSPSEDHTYSAGGSGASTPHANSIGTLYGSDGKRQQSGSSDSLSHGISSDAAYESSEDCNNCTRAELEDRQRHRDGVDALLSLSSSIMCSISSTSSPVKRRLSISVEEDGTTSPTLRYNNFSETMQLSDAKSSPNSFYNNQERQQTRNLIFDEIYTTQNYYHRNVDLSHYHMSPHSLTSSSPPKKSKPLRSLRTKIKRKSQWMR